MVRVGNTVIADTTSAKVMHETRLPAMVYIPFKDVASQYIKSSDRRTFCPFKGTATYWHIDVGDQRLENSMWCYQRALPEAKDVEGYVGFMSHPQITIEMTDGPAPAPVDGYISGPAIDWIMRAAWLCRSPEELTAALSRKLVEQGIAVFRLNVMIWSLHPMIAAKSYTWTKQTDEVVTRTPSYDLLDHPAYINSPLRHVTNGLGGVRQSLLADNSEFSFPIMDELKEQGASDYVAMPLPFSNGQTNVLSISCDHPKGFTTSNLGLVFECLTVISRYYEVFNLKENASSLLETYLGKRTGARVLGGEIRRGDGEEIDASILFCDLRRSTMLEEKLGRSAYLTLLNEFFELATDIINRHDGEVLKFVGDAVLAIFPVRSTKSVACKQALSAACEIAGRMSELGDPDTAESIECAIGIAFGNVTYGNIGSRERLDFTVIGSAANIAARLGDLGKNLEQVIITGPDFADVADIPMDALGSHSLRNVSSPIEAFAVAMD